MVTICPPLLVTPDNRSAITQRRCGLLVGTSNVSCTLGNCEYHFIGLSLLEEMWFVDCTCIFVSGQIPHNNHQPSLTPSPFLHL